MLLYLDESGCLGFDFCKQGTSDFFTITVLSCDSRQEFTAFKKAVKRTLRNKINRGKKNSAKQVQELKGSDTSLKVKRYFLNQAPKSGWQVYAITINKRNAKPHLTTKNGKVKLYNFLAKVLLEKIPFLDDGKPITLVLDKSKSKSEIEDFNQYFARQIEGRLPVNTPLNIYHEDSKANPCLQAVDLFCWGIVRQKSRGNEPWFEEYKTFISKNIMYF